MFYKNIYDNLLKNNFNIIKGFYSKPASVVDYAGFFKPLGSVALFVIVIDVKKDDVYYKELVTGFENFANEFRETNNLRHISIANILVSEQNYKDNVELIEFCSVTESYVDYEVINCRWIVDVLNKDTVVLGNQVDKLYSIEKFIKQSFEANDSSLIDADINQTLANNERRKQSYIKSKNTILTFILIMINLIIFSIMEFNGGPTIENLNSFGAINPYKVIFEHEYYRLFTSMFIHIGYTHLMSNMFSLYIMGTRVERYMGKISYIIVYILSGLSGAVFSVLFTRSIAAGASGAIFGLEGAILTYSFINKRALDDLDYYTIFIIALLGISIGSITANVDNFGHLGGFIGGIIVTLLLHVFKKTPVCH